MFLNKITPVMMGALLLCLIVVNCDRELTTNQEDEPNSLSQKCIKDGTMTLSTVRRYRLPDGSTDLSYDSLFVSETEHRIDVDNGVPFQVPEMWHLEISYSGNFEGMPNKVFYTFRYKRESIQGEVIEGWMTGEVHNNATGVILISVGNTTFDIQGIIFCLDIDSDHSGEGTVIIEHDNIPIDTVSVDANKNTVVFGTHATCMPITLNSSDICIDVHMFDQCSFTTEDSQAVWFVQDDSTQNLKSFYTSKNSGQFLAEQFSTHVKLWAFSTCFHQLEEIQNE